MGGQLSSSKFHLYPWSVLSSLLPDPLYRSILSLRVFLSSLLPYPGIHLSFLPLSPWCTFSSLLPRPWGTFVIVQEQYLPFILHAKLKTACTGELDPSLVSFIETGLQDDERKALLEVWLHCKGAGLICVLQNNYSDELALFYILKDDNDRADYYIDNSYQLFIRVFPYVMMSSLVMSSLLHRIGPI